MGNGELIPHSGVSIPLDKRFANGVKFPQEPRIKKLRSCANKNRQVCDHYETGGNYSMSGKKTLGFDQVATYRETITYDENGEVIADTVSKVKSQNGSGFVISYTEKMCEFLAKCSTGSTVRVFLFIAHHQAFGSDGVQFGYRCTHKYLQQVLNLDRKSVYNALADLKEKFLVNETKIDGCTEFMVNPQYVTIGADKKARVAEWNRRWEQHWKKVNR